MGAGCWVQASGVGTSGRGQELTAVKLLWGASMTQQRGPRKTLGLPQRQEIIASGPLGPHTCRPQEFAFMVTISRMQTTVAVKCATPELDNPSCFQSRRKWQNAELDVTAVYNPGRGEHKLHAYCCQSQGECLRRKTNANAVVQNPEVAKATKSWVGMYYCQDPSWSHCSLTLPRDTWPGASSPRRAHNPPQTVATSCRTLTKWEQPRYPSSGFHIPLPSLMEQVRFTGCYFAPAGLGRGTDTRRWPTRRGRSKPNWSNRAVWLKENKETHSSSFRYSGLNTCN